MHVHVHVVAVKKLSSHASKNSIDSKIIEYRVIPIPADYAELCGDIRQCQYGRGGTTAQTLSALLTRTSEQHTPCVCLLHHSQVQVQVQVHGEPQLP